MEKKINPNCPCLNNCPRHGDCEACRENHKANMTCCQRLEKAKQQKPTNP